MASLSLAPTIEESQDAGSTANTPMCFLVQMHPLEAIGRAVQLSEKSCTLGRDDSCDVHVLDAAVSRRHAAVECRDSDFYVVDRASTNGLFVNGTKTTEQRLSSGDRIQLGDHIFKFVEVTDRSEVLALM